MEQITHSDLNDSQRTYDYDSSCCSRENVSVLREQDRFLPIANVARIMKQYLPENGKIAKDAKQCLQECVSEFISFITSEASERCRTEKRKTINGEDIIHAIRSLGFDNYVEPLTVFLSKYREGAKSEMNKMTEDSYGNQEQMDPNLNMERTDMSDSILTSYQSPYQIQQDQLNFNNTG